MTLRRVYDLLFAHYGPQHWWPGDSPFEVMVGAVLTQNTAWGNVERAITNLKANEALSPEAIVAAPQSALAEWLRPSGYFNVKAKRLREYCMWYLDAGGYESLSALSTESLRHAVLAVKGVGPETADDILLYAFDRPVFVIDAYTRRLAARLALASGHESYEDLRALFERGLGGAVQENVAVFNEYHALVVAHAKLHCRKRPVCDGCPFRRQCPGAEVEGHAARDVA
jgi:endonuclease-3 related protein